ncbi:unnamed protein product [Rotaria sordida]|uniref:Fork-head domain-containing protein n=1 Tax=Rotaria sordida TaxID=392033 RepID=A0A814LNQ3_9BILA|nr:unnamed protein product [Rotaria sordida]
MSTVRHLYSISVIQFPIYYPQHSEYSLVMNKHQFHDSGIVDEGLSDETGSIEDDLNQQENYIGKTKIIDENEIPKKPNQSYLEIIAEAILKTPNRMMQLYEIYNYFQRKYRYFAEDINKSWKNSVRHNLSLNDCFVKAERGTNGKGHYWRIHELAEKELEQGRFHRRRYRQQIRQLQMHNQSMSSFYPSTSYYMYSSPPPPPPPSYHSIYPTQNNSSTTMTNFCMRENTYPSYDPYSSSYYQQQHPMTLSYTSQNESASF